MNMICDLDDCPGGIGPMGAWRSIADHVTEGYLLWCDLVQEFYEDQYEKRFAAKAACWLGPVGWLP